METKTRRKRVTKKSGKERTMRDADIIKILDRAAADRKLLPRDSQVLKTLATHCDSKGCTTLQPKDLAKEVRACIRTAYYSYGRLTDAGFISIRREGGVLETRLLF